MPKCERCGRKFNRFTKGWACPDLRRFVCQDCVRADTEKAIQVINEFDREVRRIHREEVKIYSEKVKELQGVSQSSFPSIDKTRREVANVIKRKYGMYPWEFHDILRKRPLVYIDVIDGWAEKKLKEWTKGA